MRTAVELSWEPAIANDAVGYKITWTDGNGPDRVVTVGGDVHQAQLSVWLKAKTRYTFSISVFDVAGNEGPKHALKVVYLE